MENEKITFDDSILLLMLMPNLIEKWEQEKKENKEEKLND